MRFSSVAALLLEWVSTCADTPRALRTQSRVSNLVSGPVHFGDIPEEHWHQPPWINETKATEEREKMIMQGIPYSESISCVFPLLLAPFLNSPDDGVYAFRYRNMCRFNSGVRSILLLCVPRPIRTDETTQFFFRHPLMQDFRYYWRVE